MAQSFILITTLPAQSHCSDLSLQLLCYWICKSPALGKHGVLGLVSRQMQPPHYLHCSPSRDLIRAQSPGGPDAEQYLKWKMAFPFRVHNLIMWWKSIERYRAEKEGCIIGAVALHIINTNRSPSSLCISYKTHYLMENEIILCASWRQIIPSHLHFSSSQR